MKFTYYSHKGQVRNEVTLGEIAKRTFFPAWATADGKVTRLTAHVKALEESKEIFKLYGPHEGKEITINAKGAAYLYADHAQFHDCRLTFTGELGRAKTCLTMFGDHNAIMSCVISTEGTKETDA